MSAHLKPPVSSADHSEGSKEAPVVLVEYGDYECPHCGRAYPIIKSIQQQLGDKLRFVFRNFPLAESHPHAVLAAVASEAAARQGEFWPMHDLLYENQQALDKRSVIQYASQLGLDTAQFEKDLADENLEAKVELDLESGIRSGVNGTPSFFVNGEKYNGSWAPDELLEFLQSAAGGGK